MIAANTSSIPPAAPAGGIFWWVRDAEGRARLLADALPLDRAEPYGDCLTYPDGHYVVWERWR